MPSSSRRILTGPAYVTEGSEQEGNFIFFGYVFGMDAEWGYFSLAELTVARGPFNLAVERGLYFTPAPFSEVLELHRKQFGGLGRPALFFSATGYKDLLGHLVELKRPRSARAPGRNVGRSVPLSTSAEGPPLYLLERESQTRGRFPLAD